MSSISALAATRHHHPASVKSKSSLLASGSAGSKATPPKIATGAGASLTSGGISKLEKAVTDALQSVQNSDQTDPNQAIQSALTKIFKSGSGSDPGGDDGNTTASTTAGKSFADILKSFGVSSSQFQTDVQAAIQKAGATGKIDPATLFKSFPLGSTLNTSA